MYLIWQLEYSNIRMWCVCVCSAYWLLTLEPSRVQEVRLLVLLKFPFDSAFNVDSKAARKKTPLWMKAWSIVKLYRKQPHHCLSASETTA